jgi:hypothetical protein
MMIAKKLFTPVVAVLLENLKVLLPVRAHLYVNFDDKLLKKMKSYLVIKLLYKAIISD